jgi:glycosyltransferase involved in cell wall biosynthesis
VVGNRILRDARAGIAIANNEIPQFAAYGVAANRVTVIPNGIDPKEFTSPDPGGFRVKFGLPDAPFVLFMGRLNSIKGPDLLLQAFAQTGPAIRHYHLVFAGPDGGMLKQLREMAARAGVKERVHFIGHVGARDKVSAYHASDLLVIPSRQEAMSIVVLEAGVCDRPVLITDSCGFAEVERIGGGRVVSASTDGLKSGLLDMLSDVANLHVMGGRLGAFVRQNFLWEFACRRYLELFSRLRH